MKNRILLKLSILLIACCAVMASASAPAPNFKVVTYANSMTVKIPMTTVPKVNGVPIAKGTEIGVFSPKGQCNGVGIWDGTKDLTIAVYAETGTTAGDANSMRPGDILGFQIWDNTSKTGLPATVKFIAGSSAKYDNAATSTVSSLTTGSALSVTAPTNNQKIVLGTTFAIKWNTVANTSVKTVKVALSIDGGAYTTLGTTSTNTGSFSWIISNDLIPGAVSKNCVVRVTDAGDTNDIGSISKQFTLIQSLAITSPGANQVLKSGSTLNIAYTAAGNVGEIVAEYTINGKQWNLIKKYTASNGTNTIADFKLPDSISSTCKVRIYKSFTDKAPDNNPIDSSAVFTIIPTITISNPPATKATWVSGTIDTIRWTATGSSGKLKLEYKTSANGNWTGITPTVVASAGKFAWTIPQVTANQATCNIRLTDTALTPSTNTSAQSNVFAINPAPGLTLVNPDADTSWAVGSKHNITWTTTGTVDSVKLEFRKKTSAAWSVITAKTVNDKSYTWTIPDSISDSCKVRISVVGNPTVFDTSSKVFKIVAPTLTLTYPNGGNNGQTWTAGNKYTITWNTNGVKDATHNKVKIELTTDSSKTWVSIKDSIDNKDTCTYLVPADMVTANYCKIRVSQVGTGVPRDSSNAYFKIVAKNTPSVTLTAPNTAMKWFTGTDMPITWTTSGVVDSVKLEYSIDNGTKWRLINRAVADTLKKYTWQISDTVTPSTKCLVRISANVVEATSDVSAANFTLAAPTITVVSPKGGEVWNATSTTKITWTSDSIISKVKLEYSSNNGGVWVSIKDTVANNKGGTYDWTTPDVKSDSCKVRITMLGRTAVSGSSAAIFAISPAPKLALASPNGGENLKEGDKFTIAWGSYDLTGKLKIDFSKDNGKNWTLLKDSVEVSDGTYTWTVPGVKSDSCKIRISAKNFTTVADSSNNMFSIELKVAVFTLPTKACLLGAGIIASKTGFAIRIASPKSIMVSARIINLQGREIMSIQNKNFSAGYNTLMLSSPSLKNGYYVAEVNLGGTMVRKAISFVK